jgi:hypothetical protein
MNFILICLVSFDLINTFSDVDRMTSCQGIDFDEYHGKRRIIERKKAEGLLRLFVQ